MGLDQHAYIADLDDIIDSFHTKLSDDDLWGCDFWHWGKDYDLFDWMRSLYQKKKKAMGLEPSEMHGSDEMELTKEDFDLLEQDLDSGRLKFPQSTHPEWVEQNVRGFIEMARRQIKEGFYVYYSFD